MITETLRDTTVVVRPDSATVEALLQCDSTNRVLVNLLNTQNGDRVSADLDMETHPDGTATLTVDCRTDSLILELRLRDREIKRLQSETHTILVPRRPTWWQRTFIATGILFTVLILSAIGVGIRQGIKKIKK